MRKELLIFLFSISVLIADSKNSIWSGDAFVPPACLFNTAAEPENPMTGLVLPNVDMPADPGTVCSGVLSTEIVGTVWEDWNYDGIMNQSDTIGVQGVTVILTDGCTENVISSVLTDADGNYEFTGLTPGVIYRVKFTLPASISSWAKPTKAGVDNGTSVQFVQPGNCASLGIANPSNYCEPDPLVAIPCYVNGDPLGGGSSGSGDWMVYFRNSNLGQIGGGGYISPEVYINGQVIGTTWGTAYHRTSRNILAAATMKRHTGFGSGGTGAIYKINTSGTPTLFADFNSYSNVNTGADTRGGTNNTLPSSATVASRDINAFQAVGKVGFGDIELSDDGEYLYAINLNDRTLIQAQIGANLTVPATVDTFRIADRTANLLSGNSIACGNASDYRPWGLKYHKGLLYIGVVCSAETSQTASDLHTYVLSFDPSNPGAGLSLVLDMPMDYAREAAFQSDVSWQTIPGAWRPWALSYTDATILSWKGGGHPSPILSDIEIDNDGSMMLGFMDRFGMQGGYRQYSTDLSDASTSHQAMQAGDVIRFCMVNGSLVREGGAGCSYNVSPVWVNQPPHMAVEDEFYAEDEYHTTITNPSHGHPETALGNLAFVPGSGELITGVYDPFALRSGGVAWWSNTDGSVNKEYELYESLNQSAPDGTFGKATGLGDIELMCGLAPLELGNYVWNDADGDGIQDACESGISGVTVELVKGGTVIASTQTSASGQYYFSDKNSSDVNLTWTGTGADTALLANTAYVIRISNATGGSQQTPLNNLLLSTTDANSNNSDETDNDGAQNGTSVEITITTGNAGEVDHSLDFGFYEPCELNMTVSSQNCTGSGPYLADWQVIITYSGAPTGDITYQKNSESTLTFTPNVSPDTITISTTADGGLHDTIRVYFSSETTCGDTAILKRPVPCPTNLGSESGEICNAVGATEIKGTVFEDWNYDGVMNQSDTVGVQGIQVDLYDDCGSVAQTTYTDSNGNYEFTGLTGGTTYRVEFTLPEAVACWACPTKAGADNGTAVQFVQPGNCASLGIANPNDYCQSNPVVALSCFLNGTGVGSNDPSIVSFMNQESGLPQKFTVNGSVGTASNPIENATIGQVGSVWGSSFHKESKLLFVSAVLKRHSGLGTNGTGGVYYLDFSNPTAGMFSGAMDLNGVSPANGGATIDLGSVTRTTSSSSDPNYISTDKTVANYDIDAFGKVGKVGFGDIEFDEGGNNLWLVNLNQQALIKMDVSAMTGTASVPNPTGTTEQYLLSSLSGIPSCTNGVFRPWALSFQNGVGYLGGVCTAESSSNPDRFDGSARTDLVGYVLSFDPANISAGFKTELSFDFEFNREGLGGTRSPALSSSSDGSKFQPWASDWSETGHATNNGQTIMFAQPIISDIEFTDDKSMILGITDRFGYQSGRQNRYPVSGNTSLYSIASGGDLFIACYNGTSWDLEGSTAGCMDSEPSSSPFVQLTNDGPNNVGEFFWQDYHPNSSSSGSIHREMFLGGLSLRKGSAEVLSITYNPLAITDPPNSSEYTHTNGIQWHYYSGSNVGEFSRGYQIVEGDDVSLFGKAAGLGDPTMLCNPAPIEVGNYVWNDADNDGIQDACESGISGVTVELVKGGTVIAMTQTSSTGQYYFSDKNASDVNLTWTGTGADTTLLTNMAYVIRISNVTGGSQQTPLNNFLLTVTDANSNNSDNIDNDASANGTSVEAMVTTGDAGCMDHSIDFGFMPNPCLEITEIVSNRTICSGENVDTLAVTTTFTNPDSIAFVYFTSAQTDSSVIYTGGTGIDTVQIAAGNDTVRITNVNVATFVNATSQPDTFYVYGIAHPTPGDNTCRPYEEILVIVNPLPDLTVTPGSICLGDSILLTNLVTDNLSLPGSMVFYSSSTDAESQINALASAQVSPNIFTVYFVRKDTPEGCKNIAAIPVTVNPIDTTDLSETICEGTSHSFNNQSLTLGGVYLDTLSQTNGCDSILRLTLTVNPVDTTDLSETICEGSSHSFNNQTLTSSGVYLDTLLQTNGCDSILRLTLTVNPVDTTDLSETICEGSSHSFNNQSLTSGGVYLDTLSQTNGCDSILRLTLTVNPVDTTDLSETICEGTSHSFNNQSLTLGGVYLDTLSQTNGCDSILRLTLTVNPVDTTDLSETICEGSSHSFNNQSLTSGGVYLDTLSQTNGCDSILRLTLTVNPVDTTDLSETICEGSSYSFNNQSLTLGGVYLDTLSQTNGCDSILRLTLTVNSVDTTDLSETICEGSSHSFNNQSLTSSGVYLDTLSQTNGCDSILRLTLTVNPVDTTDLSETICEGSSHSFNNQSLTLGGVYLDTLSQTNGCDSILRLTLTVNSVDTTDLSETICEGSSHSFNNQSLTSSGVYLDTLSQTNGCDSILRLTLTVNSVDTTDLSETICEGTGHSFNNQSLTSPGVYLDTLSQTNGCDSILRLTLTVNPVDTTDLSETICEGTGHSFNNQSLTSSGVYLDTLSQANGCDSILRLTLTVNPLPQISTRDTGVCLNAFLDLSGLVTDGNTLPGCTSFYPSLSDAQNQTNFLLSTNVAPTNTTKYFVRKNTLPGTGTVAISEVEYLMNDRIELINLGNSTVDISSWWFCSLFSYGQLNTFTVVSGDLNLSPGEKVVISGFGLNDTAADLGLYQTNSFADPNEMIDFVQWGSAGNGRESVADTKGIWTAGDFVPTLISAGNSNQFDGEGTSSSDWSEASATLGLPNSNFNIFQCFAIDSLIVNVPDAPVAGITSNNETCNELNNGSANAGATGGTGGYTYLWSTAQTTQGISGLAAGSYTVTVTDSLGCADTVSTIITEPDTLKISFVSSDETCNSSTGSATVSAMGGSPSYSYLWSSGETVDNISAKAAGTYIVTVTDANSCTVIDSVIILNVGSPNTGSVTYTGCMGDGYSVTVEGNVYNEANPMGTETVSGGNAEGCDSVITINLVFNPKPILTAIDSTVCEGASVDLAGLFSATAGTVTYHSSLPPNAGNVLASNIVSPVSDSVFYAMTIDGNGCSDTLGVTISPDSPDVSFSFITEGSGILNDTVVCHGGAINFGGQVAFGSGTGDYSYEWSANPSDSVVFTGSGTAINETGTFSNRSTSPLSVNIKLVVTDSLGCKDSVDFDATVQPQLTIDSIQVFDNSGSPQDQGVCFGDSISFKTHISPSGSYTYNWDTGATTDSIRIAPPYTNVSTVYNVTVTDAFGCAVTQFTSAKGFPEITASVSFKQSCTSMNPDTLIYNVSGGVPAAFGYIFTVSTEALPINSFASPFKLPISESAGTVITTVIDDEKGCGPTLMLTVPAVNYLDLTMTSSPEMCNDSTGTATASVSGGTLDYTYLWSNNDTTATISGLKSGTYIVTVTDAAACVVIDSVEVSNAGVANTGSESYNGCSGDGYSIMVNGVEYNESNPTGMQTLTNAAGCDSVVTIALTYEPLPEISTRDSSVCLNSSLDLSLLVQEDNAIGGTITYHPTLTDAAGNTNAITSNVVLTDTTTYYIRKTSAADCFDIDSILVNLSEFDLALKKTLLTSGTVRPNDLVDFEIKVYNQGACDATEIIVHDYIPTGLALNDPDWGTGLNEQIAVDTIANLAAGDSATLQITLRVNGNALGTYINNAEIVSAIGGTDADGLLTAVNDGTSNELATDNDVDDNGPGTPGTNDNSSDEDDYDPAQVIIDCPVPVCLPVTIEKMND